MDEDINAFVELGQGLEREFNPQGDLEHAFVERIAALLWRLKRAGRIESGVLFYQRNRIRMVDPEPGQETENEEQNNLRQYGDDWAKRGLSYIAGEDSLAKLSRYESSIQRNLLRTIHELQRLQAARKGEPVMAPQALDIDVMGLPENT